MSRPAARVVDIARPQLSEKQFTSQIVDLAKLFGWRRYHTWRSINSPAGFPDEVLVRHDRLIFAELKAQNGKVSPLQQEWLDDLANIPGVEVYLWRPSDLDEITRILR